MIGLTPFNTLPFNALPQTEIWRGLSSGASCMVGTGQTAAHPVRAIPTPSVRAHLPGSMTMAQGQSKGGATDLSTRKGFPIHAADGIAFGPASARYTVIRAEWGLTERIRQRDSLGFGPALGLATATESMWTDGLPLHQVGRMARARAARRGILLIIRLDPGLARRRLTDLWFRAGRHPVYVAPVPAAPGLPAPAPFQGDPHLVFLGTDRADGHKHLVFRRRKLARALPTLEFYTVNNTAYVKRVSDDAAIHCKSIRIGGDRDSWSLRFSGELFPTERAKLTQSGGPVEIEIGLNGVVFRAVVKIPRGSYKFGGDTLSFEGVSKSAALAAPYAALRTRTNAGSAFAQQIAAAEIENSGWTLDWQMVDWLVPAGAYSVAQATPIEAIKRLVEAAGGYLQTDRVQNILRALPRYAVMPWHWATTQPDVILSPDALESLGSDWVEKPAYNGVYVSGQHHGVNAWVMRDGTAGANLAPMVVDALITHQDANRARGEAILADTGVQEDRALALAVFPEVGILAPGQLVQVSGADGWKGLVKSFSVDAQWQGDGGLIIYQSATLERHYD